jgi:putative hydrolase of the HAD superfamily
MEPFQPPVEAVFLDVGGVFHLPRHEPVLGAFRRLGMAVDAALLDQAHYAGVAALSRWPEGDSLEREVRIWRTFLEAYARELEVPPERLEEAMDELEAAFATPGMWSRHVPGSLDALRDLAATGVALAIVSNSDGTLEARLAAEGVCQVGPGAGVPVAVVVDSGAVGVAKPDPAIFRFALEATGVDPGRVVHVGDTVGADVDGARAAGIQPLHLDPYGFCTDDSHSHLADFAALAPLVAAQGRRPGPGEHGSSTPPPLG